MCTPGRWAYGRCMSTLTRPRRGAMIAGVCAGLARRFDTTPTIVRALAIVSCLLPGPQILAYLILWVVMPRDAV
jgi:phage shock protein PspC (stress-responsive transcriptional regulator)